MRPLAGKPILEHLVDRIEESALFSEIFVATSLDPRNGPIVELAHRRSVAVYQGEEEDVLDRYVQIVRDQGADNCMRFCADNPLTDMETAARLVELHKKTTADYTCVKGLQLQLGLTECVSSHALETAHSESDQRESFTLFIRENADRFRISALQPDPFLHQSPYRLTIDYEEDFQLLQSIFDFLYLGKPIPYRSAIEFLRDNPEIAKINADVEQKPNNRLWESLDARLPEGNNCAVESE